MPTAEQLLSRFTSQRAIREGDRNAQLRRQQQIQQIQNQIRQQQEQQRQQQEQQRQQQLQSSQGNDEVRQYNYGRKLGMSGKSAYGLTKIEQQGYRDAREGLNAVDKYKQSIKEFQAQQLTGVTAPSQTSGLYQGPIQKGFDEGAFRTSGTKTPVRNNLFQGPVMRFQDPQYYAETGKLRQLPLVVSPARTFQTEISQLGKDIKTSLKENNIPEATRQTLGKGTSLIFREGVRKTEEKLKQIGVGSDSPLFKQTSFSTSKVVGDVALGSLLVGISGTSGQLAVSRYVRNGRVYYVDSRGQVIGSETVEEASKNIVEFRQALRESSVFKKAGSSYYNEPNLREKTRELINKASPKQLESLRNLYKKEGRLDLFDDILRQEKDIAIRTNTATSTAIKDKPVSLAGSGPITSTSKYAGTGQYERTEQVAVGIPKIQNPSLMSDLNVAFGQSNFDRNKLAQINSLGLQTKQQQIQNNIIGLRQPQDTNQGSRLGSALLSALRQQQQQRQAQRQFQRQGFDFGFKGRGRRIPRPVRIPFGFNLPESSIGSGKKLTTKDILGFAVEVRRKGKFGILSKESTIGEALSKAQRYTDVTLARSFRIRDLVTGKLVKPSSVSALFRPSKREANVFVEKSKFALGGSELSEIKLFKKSRRGKNGFKI